MPESAGHANAIVDETFAIVSIETTFMIVVEVMCGQTVGLYYFKISYFLCLCCAILYMHAELYCVRLQSLLWE